VPRHDYYPLEDEVRSGRVLVRMPVSLHNYLVQRARAELVSLNMFIVSLLAKESGWANPDSSPNNLTREIESEMWKDRLQRAKE